MWRSILHWRLRCVHNHDFPIHHGCTRRCVTHILSSPDYQSISDQTLDHAWRHERLEWLKESQAVCKSHERRWCPSRLHRLFPIGRHGKLLPSQLVSCFLQQGELCYKLYEKNSKTLLLIGFCSYSFHYYKSDYLKEHWFHSCTMMNNYLLKWRWLGVNISLWWIVGFLNTKTLRLFIWHKMMILTHLKRYKVFGRKSRKLFRVWVAIRIHLQLYPLVQYIRIYHCHGSLFTFSFIPQLFHSCSSFAAWLSHSLLVVRIYVSTHSFSARCF